MRWPSRKSFFFSFITAISVIFFYRGFMTETRAQTQELVSSGVVFNVDSSANSSRSQNTEIRVPQNLVNPSQGWMAARMKMGFASNTTLSPDPNIMDMSQSNSAAHFIYYDAGSDTFHFERGSGTVSSQSQNFAVGALKTVIVTWTSSQIKISVDGAPFVSLNNSNVPAQAPFSIGSSDVQGTGRQPNSDYYWVAGGSGFLTDANAAAIHAFGNTDKRRVDFPGNATFIWWASNDFFNSDGTGPTSPPTSSTPTSTNAPTLRPSSTGTPLPTNPPGTLPGDSNGDGRVDGIDFSRWLQFYNQNTTRGPQDGDYDRSGKIDGIDFTIWLQNYGRTSNTGTPTSIPTGTSTVTPRPSTNTPIPTNPPPTGPQPTVPPSSGSGIWISTQRIAQLPASGAAWDAVRSAAYGSWGTADLSNQDMVHDTNTLAGALVYAKTGDAALRTKVADGVTSAIETENGGRTLALGRNLASYVIAADLINLKQFRPTDDARFRTWLSAVRRETLDGMTLIICHEKRGNNWGTHCGSSRAAADVYLGDTADLARTAAVFKGWLGDRASYASFDWGDLSWQCNSSTPVGINPVGCTRNGNNIDGVLPDDQRRAGGYTWPPPKENYVYGALSGVVTQANILHNAGYDAWNWQSQAIKRAYIWTHNVANFAPTGDDAWQPYLVNYIYGTSFPASGTGAGKHMGWTAWTHGR